MKILVIDDKEENLEAAKGQLGNEHELILISDPDEAEHFICRFGYDRFDRNRGFIVPKKYSQEFADNVEEDGVVPDVILTDLMMPSSLTGIGDPEKRAKYKGTEMPYGLFFILAALRRGVKYVGINSDGNHHDGPMLHSLDMLKRDDFDRSNDQYESYLSGTPFVCGYWSTKNSDGEYVKDWKTMLNILIS